jgi:hypothetical protein
MLLVDDTADLRSVAADGDGTFVVRGMGVKTGQT